MRPRRDGRGDIKMHLRGMCCEEVFQDCFGINGVEPIKDLAGGSAG
jgi:hypothetical protein